MSLEGLEPPLRSNTVSQSITKQPYSSGVAFIEPQPQLTQTAMGEPPHRLAPGTFEYQHNLRRIKNTIFHYKNICYFDGKKRKIFIIQDI